REKVEHLRGLDAARKRDGAQVVPVQPAGQVLEDGVLRLGGDTLDDELVAGHPHRERPAVLEERVQAANQALRRGLERRMAAGIHGELVEADRKLDEKLTEFA